MPNHAFRLVVATREDRDGFFSRTGTGRSFVTYARPDVELRLYDRNSRGLPEIYNDEIERSRDDPATLVFIHDDVHLCDYWWSAQLNAALAQFSLVGLTGNRRRVPGQPSWAFLDASGTWDAAENLSGVVGHGPGFPPRSLDVFGPPCQPVKLLDGLLLAARSETFIASDIRFDVRFPFHFYDLDVCRQFEAKGLSMGTWGISVVHESTGNYAANGWLACYASYLEKWGD